VTASQFVEKLQAYFDATYTDEQTKEVLRWSQRNASALQKVYGSLVSKQDWRGKLPLVSKMNERLSDLGLQKGGMVVPEEGPTTCKHCGNDALEHQNEVRLCRQCKSMWLWMNSGQWTFAASQQAIVAGFKANTQRSRA
jgi:hypothetical protein